MISDSDLQNLLCHIRPTIPLDWISRAMAELSGNPIPRESWPPVDHTVYSFPANQEPSKTDITDDLIVEAACFEAMHNLRQSLREERELCQEFLNHVSEKA